MQALYSQILLGPPKLSFIVANVPYKGLWPVHLLQPKLSQALCSSFPILAFCFIYSFKKCSFSSSSLAKYSAIFMPDASMVVCITVLLQDTRYTNHNTSHIKPSDRIKGELNGLLYYYVVYCTCKIIFSSHKHLELNDTYWERINLLLTLKTYIWQRKAQG